MDLLELMMGLDIKYYLFLKNIMSFIIELDILSVKKVSTYIFFLMIMKKSTIDF